MIVAFNDEGSELAGVDQHHPVFSENRVGAVMPPFRERLRVR